MKKGAQGLVPKWNVHFEVSRNSILPACASKAIEEEKLGRLKIYVEHNTRTLTDKIWRKAKSKNSSC